MINLRIYLPKHMQTKKVMSKSDGPVVPPRSPSMTVPTCSCQTWPPAFSAPINSLTVLNSIFMLVQSILLTVRDTISRCIPFTQHKQSKMISNTLLWVLCSPSMITLPNWATPNKKLLTPSSKPLTLPIRMIQRSTWLHTEISWWWPTWTIDGSTRDQLRLHHVTLMFTGTSLRQFTQSLRSTSTNSRLNSKEERTVSSPTEETGDLSNQ